MFFDNSMFAELWLEPWFIGYPDAEVDIGAAMRAKDQNTAEGLFYRSLYEAIPTRVDFPDPSSGKAKSVHGFLAAIAGNEKTPVILFSLEEVSANRYVGYVHRVYEKEN